MRTLNLFIAVACILIATSAFSQVISPVSKVREGMTSASLQSMSSNQVEYLNFFSQQGYVVHNEAKTIDGMPLLSSVLKNENSLADGENLNQDNFNPLNYNITPRASESQFFLVDGTSKVVQIYSQSLIDQLYSSHLTNIENQKKINK